ncbi:MAG: glycosyltransferase [Mycobacteriales bacterium]
MTAPVTAPVLERLRSKAFGARAPRVAVVVSTHGRADLVGGLLAGLAAQDHDSFEVVVVDNGSQDATWQVLSAWAASTALPVLVLRVGFCDGPAVPRNTAVAEVTAPLLAFTDDDCLPAPGWLTGLEAALVPGVAVAQGATAPEAGAWAGPWGRSLSVQRLTGLCETANLGCRTADFRAVGGFPADRLLTGRAFGEDVLLGAALAGRGAVVFAPAAQVEHRVLPGSYRDFLRERRRLRGFPLLRREVPSLAQQGFLRVFLSARTARADLGVAGLVAGAVVRSPLPVLAAAPWAVACWRSAAGRPGRPRAVRAAQVAVGDVVALAGLVEGSLRARRVCL